MFGRNQESLGRHRTAEALAAYALLFDQHDRYAPGGRGGRDREPSRAAADHAEIRFLDVLRHWLGELTQLLGI